jgi:hypothetical protein
MKLSRRVSHVVLFKQRPMSTTGYDICNTFKLSAESLRYKWEAMCYNASRKTMSNSLNLENARDLRAHINREVTAAADLAAKRARIARTTGPRTGRLFSGTSFGTPTVKREALEHDIPDQSAASTTFETNSNRTKCCMSSRLSYAIAQSIEDRYMYEKISERSDGAPGCSDFYLPSLISSSARHPN